MTDNANIMASSLLLGIILSSSDQDGYEGGGFNASMDDSLTAKEVRNNNNNNKSLTSAVQCLSTYELLREVEILDNYFRRQDKGDKHNNGGGDLYRKVRALLFLYAIHRFHLPERRRIRRLRSSSSHSSSTDYESGECREDSTNNEKSNAESSLANNTKAAFCPKGYAALLDRRFDDAIDCFLASVEEDAIFISPDDRDDEIKVEDLGRGPPTRRQRRYVVPQQISLVSNLTYSPMKDGLAVTTTQTTAECTPSSDSLEKERHLLSNIGTGSMGHNNRNNPSRLPLPSDATSSALAKAYRELAFQTLAGQVRNSVRSHPGNEWMFRLSDVKEQPLRWSNEMMMTDSPATVVLVERTPVRMDLCHSCWSDIFFLAMDYPEAARVINLSVDLSVRKSSSSAGSNSHCRPAPPIECRLKLTTTNPGTINLTSVDLKASTVLTHVSQVFAYGADHLGLLKAGLVASGVVPPGLEEVCKSGSSGDIPLEELLSVMMMPPIKSAVDTTNATAGGDRRRCAYGLELTTHVRDIPKGSRLAVSTNLLGSIIALCMRATRQISSISGPLLESDRRLVAARAILGEWLGGSGGGWQDSGGLWPGLKLISGVVSEVGDPEFGISRGRLLPSHHLLKDDDAPESLLHALEKSLVLVHGGMAQNVG